MRMRLLLTIVLSAAHYWSKAGAGAGATGEMSPPPVRLVCYYSLPSQADNHGLLPEGVDPYMCTHINIAFAIVAPNNSLIPTRNRDLEDWRRVAKLKARNPHLMVLISVQSEMKRMVANRAARSIFAESCLDTLKLYKLDGIDLDWEFPDDARKFNALLAEMRRVFADQYLLTVAVAAPQQIADISYRISVMARFVDWVNLMSYDFHAFSKFTPLTGLNAPLYAGKDDKGLLAQLNTNWSARYWESKGMPRSKIVVGIPTYGHSFTLVNRNNHGIGAPASGGGYLRYSEVCMFLLNGSADVIFDPVTKSPYAYKGLSWVSFENNQSVTFKAEFAIERKYVGIMIWSLNNDDFSGSCYNLSTKFPLMETIRRAVGRVVWMEE